jgi:putative tributyrin esterase
MSSVFRTIEFSDAALTQEGLCFATVKSRALGRRADITFYIPPQTTSQTSVPIIVLMHGVFGSHWAWVFKGGAHVAAARLIALDILPPVVIAMPSDGLWGDGSGYVAHNECDYERWIMEEVRAAAIEACASCDQNSSLLLAGLSMGGFAALRLAGKYPERVSAAAAHSAVTEASELDPLIEENRSGWSTSPEDVSVIAALRAAGDRLPPIRFDCGREDPFLQSNRLLHDMLESNGIAHIYAEADGGHNWSYWQREIDQTFRFFGALLKEKTLHKVR